MTANGNYYEAPRRPPDSRLPYGEESPEALRRRAEALLDEMMLGAVDGGIADFGVPSGEPWRAPVSEPDAFRAPGNEWSSMAGRAEQSPSASIPGNGTAHSAGTPHAAENNGYHRAADETAPPPRDVPPPSDDGGPLPGQRTGADARLVSAEDRYSQVGVATATSRQEVNGSAEYDRYANSAVRRQSATLASTMSVGMRSGSRSPLLPRSTDVDVEALLEEIGNLRSEIAHALPPGQEAGERSRHLLNKAQNLLQNEPSRSAEVDYYLQQVRRTVQRARQNREGSAIYRHRMTVYLLGWLLLAIVVIASLALYQVEVQAFVQGLLDLPIESPFVGFAAMVSGAMFAGALGAAVAILINMGRHARQKYGYFDRKYGLRCLLLPILGLLFGLMVGIVWALIYYFVGADPNQLLLTWSAPLVLGFLAGFGQEWLYGAR